MARIEWIKMRLNNWALWKARDEGNGLGFASQSVLLMEPVDRYREINIYSTIDSTDASVTNEAVESLKPGRQHLYDTVQCIYLKDTGVKGAAVRLGKAPSTISANLDQADAALAAWFGERAEKKKRSLST